MQYPSDIVTESSLTLFDDTVLVSCLYTEEFGNVQLIDGMVLIDGRLIKVAFGKADILTLEKDIDKEIRRLQSGGKPLGGN